MKKSGWLALTAIISFSLLIRTIPLYEFTLWGMDCGEYLYYTHQWVRTGGAYLSIDGWGNAYPFFPGMFILGGGFHLLSGTDIITSTMFVPVIISAFSPLFIFVIVHKVMADWRSAILSAFFFTCLPPLIYAFSQPRPETVGFFFVLLALSLNISYLKEYKRTSVPILVSLIALIITHHFSTYFFILFLLGGITISKLWRKEKRNLDRFKTILLVLSIIITVVYWILYATPFARNRIKDALLFPNYSVIIVPFALLIIVEILTVLRRRSDFRVPINLHKQEIKSFMIFVSIAVLLVLPVLLTLIWGTIPGRDIKIGSTALLYLPLLILALFAISSRKITKTLREGPTIWGWFILVFLSSLTGFITGTTSLLPSRHLAFFLILISIFFGIGLFHFNTTIYNPGGSKKKAVALGSIILLLTAFIVPLSFPSQERAGGFTEGVEFEDMEPPFWIKDAPDGKIATGHRMSAASFSVGNKNLTWTKGEEMYFSSDLDSAVRDLNEHNVSYIMWDQEMLKGTATEAGENPRPLNKELMESYGENFYLIYTSEECKVYAVG